MKNNNAKRENNKIVNLYISEEMAKDREMDDMIRRQLIADADAEEMALKQNSALQDQEVPSEEMFQKIVEQLKSEAIWDEEETEEKENKEDSDGSEKIPEEKRYKNDGLSEEELVKLLSEEDRKALELGRKALQSKKKNRWFRRLRMAATTAAVIVLGVFTISMGSDANRENVVAIWNALVGGELQIHIDDAESTIQMNGDEEKAYEEIYQTFDISPIHFNYRPEQFVYDSYTVDSKLGNAKVFYKYGGEWINVFLSKAKSDLNLNHNIDGKIKKIDEIEMKALNKRVELWKIDSPSKDPAYRINLELKEGFYSIEGRISKQEFIELVKGIAF